MPTSIYVLVEGDADVRLNTYGGRCHHWSMQYAIQWLGKSFKQRSQRDTISTQCDRPFSDLKIAQGME